MAENDWVRLPMGAIKGIVPATVPPSARPILVRRPGVGGAYPDGGRLHRYAIAPFEASIPFGEGGMRRRGGNDTRGRPAVARLR